MNNHSVEWLNAYYDGELGQNQSEEIARHLALCAICREQLANLSRLSELFHLDSAEDLPATSQSFVHQVMEKVEVSNGTGSMGWKKRVAWWLIPTGLVAAWAFWQALLLINSFVLRFNPIQLSTLDLPGSTSLLEQLISSAIVPRFYAWFSPLWSSLPASDSLHLIVLNFTVSSVCLFLLTSWLVGQYMWIKHHQLANFNTINVA